MEHNNTVITNTNQLKDKKEKIECLTEDKENENPDENLQLVDD